MMRFIVISAALLGFVSVALGAAGDHLLSGKLTAETAETFDVALRYHQLYAVLIFAMGLYGLKEPAGKLYRLSCLFFLLGIIIFSGSLYASLWIDLGPLRFGTPIGGMLIMGAWILAAFSFIRKTNF
jgi:uncharacterized membrane protein YgdD (TMEM256/DUF423 family)